MKITIEINREEVAEIVGKEPHELDNLMDVDYNYTTEDWLEDLSDELESTLTQTLKDDPSIIENALWNI